MLKKIVLLAVLSIVSVASVPTREVPPPDCYPCSGASF
jgi:hypothetical protein